MCSAGWFYMVPRKLSVPGCVLANFYYKGFPAHPQHITLCTTYCLQLSTKLLRDANI